MAIHIIKSKASEEQVRDMMTALESYMKLAVDVEQCVLAGGGTLHADCEATLLENGSKQQNIWGADWFPFTQEVTFESLINIRPGQNNFSMEVQNENLRAKIESITRRLLEGVAHE